MAVYSITESAARLAAASGGLSNRVEMALLKYAATRYGASPTSVEQAFIRRLAANPAGETNAALPIILAVANVANTAADPTDAELTASIGAVWGFLCGG